MKRYREFVAAGKDQPAPWEQLKNQMFLGADAFVEKMQAQLDAGKDLSEVPFKQRRALPKPIAHYSETHKDRDAAIVAAYASGGYSQKEIADHFGLHYSCISRIINHRNAR